MEENNIPQEFLEEESSFDFKEWALKIAHYWYVVLIGVLIALSLAYLENRKWKPMYKVNGQVFFGNTSSVSQYAFMQGFNTNGSNSINNQLVLFGRYELIRKTIAKLPFTVEYYTKGRFKTNYYYKDFSPIELTSTAINTRTYGLSFVFNEKNDKEFSIELLSDKEEQVFQMNGVYGVPFSNEYFSGTMHKKTTSSLSNKIYIAFRSIESLESEFSSRLSFSIMEGTSVAVVSLVGERPERDKDFINMLSNEFLADNLDRKNLEANRTIDFIDEQLRSISDSLAITTENIRNFRRENNIIDVNSYVSELLGQSAEYEKKEMELNLKETYFDYLDSYLRKNVQEETVVAPTSLGVADKTLLDLVKQFNDIQLKRMSIGSGNPLYQKYTQQLETLKETLFEVLRNVRTVYNMDRENLQTKYKKVLEEIESLPFKESKIVEIERLHRINDNYYTYLLQKRSEAQIRKASNISDNTVLQEARVGGVVNGGVKNKVYVKFCFLGILIPILLIVLKELLDNTIKTQNDLEKATQFSVLSVIPFQKMDKDVLVIKYPRSYFSESFRSLRARIEFLVRRKNQIVVMNTSAEPSDGKTYFSINLAGIYALSGKKTLLIDADLRKPSVGKVMNISAEKGLSNVLIDDCKVEDVIVSQDSFDVLPAGTIPPNPGELIASENMINLLEKLKTQYEYIVFDTTPVGLVSDIYPLTKEVDVTFLIAMSGKTSKPFLKRVAATFKKDKIKHVYAILNGVKEEKGLFGNNHRKSNYYYHSDYYYKEDEA
ncbi:MAG: polysaccharide biosynthesis tyrosine autokinase [Paludibacteraceae bacterium]|nr:polysaccharide biosynthesis tyrosine autokinase [Paludibacteraceae bacterium]